MLYARDGVWEGASGSLRRFYLDAAGNLREDELITSRHGDDPFALTRAHSDDAGQLWADMSHGSC